MIHELRVYHCAPGRLGDVMARFETTTLAIFSRHGIRPLRFWTVVVGDSSQVLMYILEWDSMADREVRWDAFQRDTEWIRAREASEVSGPIISSVVNSFLKPLDMAAKS